MQTKSKSSSKKSTNIPLVKSKDGGMASKTLISGGAVKSKSAPEGTIYIDQDSDIASVVSGVKGSEAKIVRIVAGKNADNVFSGVNLKLVARAAQSKNKEVIIVTNDNKLRGLAGLAGIKSAENLKSEAMLEKPTRPHEGKGDSDESLVIEGEGNDKAAAMTGVTGRLGARLKGKKNRRLSIPNFDDFRKKALVGIGVLMSVLVIIFLVMSSKRTSQVEVEANATRKNLSFSAVLNPEAAGNSKVELKSLRKEGSKLVEVAVPTSGQKDIGAKASGSITIVNCTDDDVTIPSGSGASTNGLTYLTTEKVVVPASDFFSNGTCKNNGKKNVDIVAKEAGTKYNIGSSSFDIAGQPSTIKASGNGTKGGTTEIIKVVAEADIQALREKLQNESAGGYQDELKTQFSSEERSFDDTFVIQFGESQITPAVGETSEEVRGKFTITYSIFGAKVDDIKEVMSLNLEDLKDSPDQSVVKDGYDTLRLSGTPEGYNFEAAAYVGPNIDLNMIKEKIVGMKKGEAIQAIKAVDGIVDAKVRLNPFWVTTLPGQERIEIKLNIRDVVE